MADTICERPLPSFTLVLYRDVAKKMETLKSLMRNNGDENSSIFFLKVIIKADLFIRDVLRKILKISIKSMR